ncbi:TonB-dependent receptor [Gilvimarinus algae]|uniref:TonB-dependent receptor n=1 Tax=Gilvimarinus algae TaxID=3058037 RepID=A0ABT8TD63_9GAMM|nr:TonB-dependent receptor [Gilvimarinus sp. SDUM040014]MDO3382039.1 TonB-dependent receptor [Gilvimarinus sp. SDUM040014]
MNNKTGFRRKLIASAVASCALTGGYAQAQEQAMLEEVVVRGVRAAQETAVNIKRDADAVVDAISAEDIGKLPDATISDSLQRIPGIQIRRSAGEGSSVNIRGLPQVITQLNGEQYLGANSVVSTQPNFGDIPSQLFKGADVYKSAIARLGNTGITGTIDLKTYRPFDFDEGLTLAGGVEAQYGTETEKTDPFINGLINWQNEDVGFMLAASYANVNLSNSYNGINTGSPGDAGWTSRFADTAVGQEDLGRRYVGSQGFSAWNQVTERERLGVNSSFQADLGEGFIFTADWFYTDQDEYNRKVGMSATNKWQGDNWFVPTQERATGTTIDGGEFYSWQSAELSPKRLKSFTQNDVFESSSNNLNLQLDYDNGGAFTGSFRAVMGEAERKKRHGYNEGDLTNGTTTGINPYTWSINDDPTSEGYVALDDRRPPGFFPASYCEAGDLVLGDQGGCFKTINPLGYSENPQITYDTTTEHPTWSGFDRPLAGGLGSGATIADYMANLDSYNVGAFSSENNENSEGSLQAFSLKGNYRFDEGFITSVDVGIRSSQRTAEFERYNLFSPFYENGCEAQWKATDVQLHAGPCQEGEMVTGTLNGYEIEDSFVGYTVLPYVGLNEYNNAIWVTDFGPVNGIPGMWAVDPADYDDPEAFHNRVFGSTSKHVIPGSTFDVDMDELSYFAQANFEAGGFQGNLGVRVVETELVVKQNIAGPQKDYGNTNVDTGDLVTRRDYTDVLPTLNLGYWFNDSLVLRFAYGENMVPLDLNQYGDGLTLNTTIDTEAGSPTQGQFIVSGGSLAGNPGLDPWRSTNYDLSVEWYTGAASVLSAAIFKVEIDSFTESTTVQMPQPDADGVIRREVPITTLVQGEGGTLEGAELAAKIAFGDFMDGFIGNFGIDTNYTYSPSEGSGDDIFGEKNLFPDNSEHQFNLTTWYQGDKFQARIAYNYRSERLAALGGGAWGALNLYQEAAAYVDVSASYDITEAITLYASGSNVTGEYENYYLGFEDQYAFQNYYEPRYTMGVRARF